MVTDSAKLISIEHISLSLLALLREAKQFFKCVQKSWLKSVSHSNKGLYFSGYDSNILSPVFFMTGDLVLSSSEYNAVWCNVAHDP